MPPYHQSSLPGSARAALRQTILDADLAATERPPDTRNR